MAAQLSEMLGDNFSTINPEITAAAAKIAGAAMGAGFQSWGTAISREILFQPGEAVYRSPAECLGGAKGQLVITTVKWGGDRNGSAYFIVPEGAVKGAVALFLAVAMASEPDFASVKLDADGMDAYSELGNAMVQQGAQKLRAEIGGKIDWSVEHHKVADGGSLGEILGKDDLLCVSGQLTIQGLAPETVYMMMTVSCTGMSAELPRSEKADGGDLMSQADTLQGGQPRYRNEDLARKIRLPVIVVLAATKKRVESVKELSPGSIIEFRTRAGEFLNVNAGNTKIADGEVVIVNQHFGIQIRHICPQIPYAPALHAK